MTLRTVEQKLFTYKIDLQMPEKNCQSNFQQKIIPLLYLKRRSKKEVSPVTACFVKGEKWL